MKRLNPKTNKPFVLGDTREDGAIFTKYRYDRLKRNGYFAEHWLKPKAFETNQKTKHKNRKRSAARDANDRARKLGRIPNWLTVEDKKQIRRFYDLAKKATLETGILHHVDHIIPLQGVLVSGLHTPWNLQVIPADQNLKKSNNFQ